MDQLANLKLFLDIADDSEDALLELYLKKARRFVINYCEINENDIPDNLLGVIEDIAVFKYRLKGVEATKAETRGGISESYYDKLPDDIKLELDSFKTPYITAGG
ncbi:MULTISPECIES: phage head-tail connector protein [Bacillus]|uniref:phage head-tail connector protein n=1 Tax=Bacillus TaxID=1386 RepID=UPI0006B02C9C|nr:MULTISPECIES: phage head-tail connector protein [Bacillus]ARJ76163.1 hypothetical protein B7941_17225 [Bacillus velezensis]AWD88873.1 hypothetical protein BVQ_16060 [Bacillus velezensis]KAF6691116.1 phage head-tail connector protein [Bacillus sp. EKM601B]KOS49037.1 hypothetical protein AN272_20520 [Bacillus amyloliquefaciens]MBA9148571.1 phage head-tail connector protein [Bacillus sp. EKM213B]